MIKKNLLAVAALVCVLAFVTEGMAVAEAIGRDAPRGSRSQRVAELPYEVGSGGFIETSWWCFNSAPPTPVSCVEFPTGLKDRFVTLEITDSTGLPVPAIVEIEDPLEPVKEPICGATTEPIRVRPGLKILVWINVRSVTSPCPGAATSGVVTAIFSKGS